MVPAALKGMYVIRFTVTSQRTTDLDIERDWLIIQEVASSILAEAEGIGLPLNGAVDEVKVETKPTVVSNQEQLSRVGQRHKDGMLKKNGAYGMSLVLSNVPMSPKFINASFAALFDTHDVIVEYARELHRRNTIDINGHPIRLFPRRKFMKEQGKQYSLDITYMATRGGLQPITKQCSLDSKIEEIFVESSVESATASEQDDSSTSDSSGNEKKSAGHVESHKEKNKKSLKSEDKNKDDNEKEKVKDVDNKAHGKECKESSEAQQSKRRVSKPDNIPASSLIVQTSAECAPPSSEKIQTSTCSPPTGTPRVCKYCKHVLD